MTPTEFIEFYPEFGIQEEARLLRIIARADPHFDVVRWGDLYTEGLASWVAHHLAVAIAQLETAKAAALKGKPATGLAETNNVTSKKVGEVQVTRDATLLARQAEEPLASTLYGQRYLSLRRLVGIGAVAV